MVSLNFTLVTNAASEDNAGARVNELSAPLAEKKISILYQSSYQSDFIFVSRRQILVSIFFILFYPGKRAPPSRGNGPVRRRGLHALCRGSESSYRPLRVPSYALPHS
jgi:hypothetical protein